MRATFSGNPETTAVVVYSPTTISNNDEELEEFYGLPMIFHFIIS